MSHQDQSVAPLVRDDDTCSGPGLRTACAQCSLRELCVPGGIPASELEKLDAIVAARRKVRRGEALFLHGDEFRSLYAVRTGFFKTRLSSSDGHDQITGFQVPGELLGLDGVATEQHGVDALALEDSEVCVLPYSELERISRSFPPLQHQLHRVMSREIVRENHVIVLLGSMRADQRVAAFLLNLSERFKHLGYAEDAFRLRMTREDIGSYLGLKLETISRTLSRFQNDDMIQVQGRDIQLLDKPKLRDLLSDGH